MHRRALNVFVAVDELRRVHPELVAPLRGTRLWDVLAREGIDVRSGRISRPARASGFDGDYVITLRRDARARDSWGWALHEFGHIKLGHLGEVGEHEKNLSPCAPDDPREDDANLFASLIFLGPAATPETPRIARIIAKIEARRYVARDMAQPAQLRLALPEPVPVYRPPSERMGPAPSPARQLGHGSSPEITADDVYPRVRSRKRIGPVRIPAPHSPYFDWSKDGKPLGWFHPTLGWIWVYDGLLHGRDGRPRWEILECGDRRAMRRRFIVGASEKRDYWFAEGEKRTRTVEALRKQFDTAQRAEAGAAPITISDPTRSLS